jgi:hypothetical protein
MLPDALTIPRRRGLLILAGKRRMTGRCGARQTIGLVAGRRATG